MKLFHFINCNIQLFSKEVVCIYTSASWVWELLYDISAFLLKLGIHLLLLWDVIISYCAFNLHSPVHKWGWSYCQTFQGHLFFSESYFKTFFIVICLYFTYCRNSLSILYTSSLYISFKSILCCGFYFWFLYLASFD